MFGEQANFDALWMPRSIKSKFNTSLTHASMQNQLATLLTRVSHIAWKLIAVDASLACFCKETKARSYTNGPVQHYANTYFYKEDWCFLSTCSGILQTSKIHITCHTSRIAKLPMRPRHPSGLQQKLIKSNPGLQWSCTCAGALHMQIQQVGYEMHLSGKSWV